MPNVVLQPPIEKILPPKIDIAPRKPAAKTSDSSFDEALKNAQPKKTDDDSQKDTKPAAKKPSAKSTAAKKTDAKPKAKPTDDEQSQTDEADAAATDEKSEDSTTAQLPPPAEDKDASAPAPKPAKDTTTAKVEDPAKQATAQADASQLVQAVNPDAQKQQQPSQDQPQDADQATKKVAVKQPAVKEAIGADDDKPAKKAATKTKSQAAAKTPAKATADAKAADADDHQDDPDATDASDDADVNAQSDDDPQPVAKSTKKPDADAAQQASDPDKPAPVELGAALKSEQPTQDVSSKPAAKDDDSDAPQKVADVSDDTDAPAAADDAPAASAHAAADATAALDLQPKQAPAPIATPQHTPAPAPAAPPPPPPEVQFAQANHSAIVTGMRGQLLPDGGTMHIRLDPPELGALQVSVHMQDGVMTATFQTSNDDATKLLSHSLGQLKHVLESQGVSVDKLHVTQTPRDADARNDETGQQKQGNSDNPQARQEQQRREILQRMWRRLANGSDPVDMLV